VNGNQLFDVSVYDRVLVIRKTGTYSVIDVPDKIFVDKGMLFCGFVDKEQIFTVLFKDNKTGFPYIKRCRIEKFILNKGYSLVPENCTVVKLTTDCNGIIHVEYKPKPRLKVLEESFFIKDYLIKGSKAGGVRLANKEVKSMKVLAG
jgi:topoisomerase-4 subunit A